MKRTLAFLVALGLASTGFGAISYDAGTFTLTYGDAADLDHVVDPVGVRLDIQQSFGMEKDAFNALNPDVIGFNTATGAGGGTPGTIVANASAGTVKFYDFAALRDAEGNLTGYQKYNWGCFTSQGRDSFSGTQAYHDLGLVQSDPPGNPKPGTGYRFLYMDISVNESSQGVAALGFALCGRLDQPTGPGSILYTLDDASTASVVLPAWGGGNALKQLFVGYVAPEGRTIVRVEGIRDGGGNCYPALDDLGFIVPEPATMGLIVLGGIGLVLRRRR